MFVGAVSTADAIFRMVSAHDPDARRDVCAFLYGMGPELIHKIPVANFRLGELAQQPWAIEV